MSAANATGHLLCTDLSLAADKPTVPPTAEPPPPTIHAAARARPRPLFSLDAGWLFLIAGIAVVGATVLVPAAADLEEARWQRNKALAIERHRSERLERYGKFLAAIQRSDDDVVLSLMATQLNRSPTARVPLTPVAEPGRTSASPFPMLEPEPLEMPARARLHEKPSLLMRLTTDDHHRLWMLAGGMVCMLIGLLPPVVRRWPAGANESATTGENPGA